ncbi:maltose/maltodextrin import ATP-binding protein MalK [Marinobacterium zhoushanense]|uniref:Maltose/maltodextrin import ATP-binding protein MalK n=1 Tax=Marinobacterium zhoushanense TaxID=1679163 RepID=A0ABQ1KAM4_9GAMM|nr:sn-glycerol-3-phosphate ABC transporter ATP-binding protein UgpC [Marinobacterium zhoushanense]GGB93983.1 maltose/maltodextrin import ATP-binding protein MalK [Marinobacterium zhoushanense]
MSSIEFVKLEKVYKGLSDFCAVKGVDLQINEGEFVVFVGPSGCGKSTLLRMIAGLEDISGGELYFGDRCVNDLSPKERGIGMVFQSYALYPHMSVFDNMAFGLTLEKGSRETIKEKVEEVARILQIDHLLDRKPKALSGGQRQRVAIGRAIVRQPNVFLFDEPLSNLDASLRVQMRIEITKLHQRLKTTSIYVTHDQVEAMTMADKIVVLNQGRIMQVGSPLQIYNEPANTFVAGFMGSPTMNFIDVEAKDDQLSLRNGQASRSFPMPFHYSGQATLGIRPEHIELQPQADAIPVETRICVVEHLGNETLLYLTTDLCEQPLVVAVSGETSPEIGSALSIYLPLERCHLFDARGDAVRRQGKVTVS